MSDRPGLLTTSGEKPDTYESLSALALSLLAENEMWSPSQIHLGRIVKSLGVELRFGATGGSDARTVRADPHAWIVVNERARGTARARYSLGHELCHYLRHPDCNAIERIHGGRDLRGRDYVIEDHANWFSSNILMPAPMFGPYCTDARPTFRVVDRIGEVFGTSRQSTGKRYPNFATSACAFVECKDGTIKYTSKSSTFRGTAVRRRRLEDATFAAALMRGESVPEGPRRVAQGTWGSRELDVEMLEQVSVVPESGMVLVWLWHA